MKKIWKSKRKGRRGEEGQACNSLVVEAQNRPSTSPSFTSLPVPNVNSPLTLNNGDAPPREDNRRSDVTPGAFRVPGINGGGSDSSPENDSQGNPPARQTTTDEIVVPNATLVEPTSDLPVVVATRGVRRINFRDRRVQLGLLLIVLAFAGVVAGLVISQTNRGGGGNGSAAPEGLAPGGDSSSAAPSMIQSEFPSVAPTVSSFPTNIPTSSPTSLSWVELGSSRVFAGGFDDRGGLPVLLSADGGRLAVGGNQYFPACCGLYLALEIYDFDGQWTNVMENNGFYNPDAPTEDAIVAMSGNGRRVAVSVVRNRDANRTGVTILDDPDGTGVFGELGEMIFGDWNSDRFGWSVGLSGTGDFVAIGAYLSDINGTDSGLVQIYEWKDSAWVHRGGNIYGESPKYGLGYVVSLSEDGNRVAIGSSYQNSTCSHGPKDGGGGGGEVRVYEFDSGSSLWNQKGQVLDWQCDASLSLSRDGTALAVGLPSFLNEQVGINLFNVGIVRIYEYMENTGWVQRGNNITGDDLNSDLGTSVSLSSDGLCVAIGTPFGQNILGETTGHTSIYSFDDGSWRDLGEIIYGERVGDESGSSVSLSSDCSIVAISSPENRGSDGIARGVVRVFQLQGI